MKLLLIRRFWVQVPGGVPLETPVFTGEFSAVPASRGFRTGWTNPTDRAKNRSDLLGVALDLLSTERDFAGSVGRLGAEPAEILLVVQYNLWLVGHRVRAVEAQLHFSIRRTCRQPCPPADRHADTKSYDWRMNSLDDARWRAVETRMKDADGVFYYAVRTTGIFCRPTCPARRPLRDNVEFYATPAEAVAAGFRACRRCHPERETVTDPTIASIIAVCRWLEHPEDKVDVGALASRVGWSQRHLRRKFRAVTGVTITAYQREQRMDRVRTLLRAGRPVTEAVFEAGYGSVRGFYESDARRLGTSPSLYRKGAPAQDIGYTIAPSALGRVLIAITDRGVCAIRLGDSDAELVDLLIAEYPHAAITRDEAALRDIVMIVVDLAAGRARSTPDIPLDLRGTAFQIEVWEELRRIPPGESRSYGEIATELGRPTSYRAVANACGANPVALLVPCHRAVRADGKAGGYRWGAELKESLLASESDNRVPGQANL